jgi:hypothetical protein
MQFSFSFSVIVFPSPDSCFIMGENGVSQHLLAPRPNSIARKRIKEELRGASNPYSYPQKIDVPSRRIAFPIPSFSQLDAAVILP